MSAQKRRRVSPSGRRVERTDHFTGGSREEPDNPPVRLSRYIPHREGMDMSLSTYNLCHNHHEDGSVPPLGGNDSIAMDSILSDASHADSIYRVVLAERLTGKGRIGGDVLQFGEKVTSNSANISGTAGSSTASSLRDVAPNKAIIAAKKPARVLHLNPEKVLDAPDLPPGASHLLDWGTNNRLIIALRTTLYQWNAETGDATKLFELQQDKTIRCVSWLHNCTCIAATINEGTTAIYDCRAEKFLRFVKPPQGLISSIAVQGPTLSAASLGPCGNIYNFDLRAKEALISTYEAHARAVTCLHYCTTEPFQLASGGDDGSVRVWDARQPSSARHSFDGVHSGVVSAVLWNPDKRTLIFTGGEDGSLRIINTHATTNASPRPPLHFVLRTAVCGSPITGICCAKGSGEVATSQGVGGGALLLRKIENFQPVGTFTSPGVSDAITSVSLAPDRERVCAAQQDETLKFWRVFEKPDCSTRKRKDEANDFEEALR